VALRVVQGPPLGKAVLVDPVPDVTQSILRENAEALGFKKYS